MEKLMYTGTKPGVYIPKINRTIKPGEVFETTKEIAESLKLQGCFKNPAAASTNGVEPKNIKK